MLCLHQFLFRDRGFSDGCLWSSHNHGGLDKNGRGRLRRWRGYDCDWLRRSWRWRRRGRSRVRQLRMSFLELVLEIFSGDFIEGTRSNLGGGNAQLFGLHENFLVLETELF